MSRIKIMDVPIKDIQVIENVRTDVRDYSLRELMESIKQHGLESPIKVGATKSGKYVLIFGQRRMEACRKLGYNTIEAQVVSEPAMQDLLVRNVTENLQRKDNTPVEVGRICVILRDRYNMSSSETATRLSVAKSQVQRCIQLFETVPKEISRNVGFMKNGRSSKNGKLPASSAYHIMRMKSQHDLTAKQVNDVMEAVRLQELTLLDIEVVSNLVSEGMDPVKAVKEVKNWQAVHFNIIVSREEMKQFIKRSGLNHSDYMRSVCYGKEQSFTKPTFVKIRTASKK